MFLFWNRISWITCYNRDYFLSSGFVTFISISLNRKPSFGFGRRYTLLTLCGCCLIVFVPLCILLGFLVRHTILVYIVLNFIYLIYVIPPVIELVLLAYLGVFSLEYIYTYLILSLTIFILIGVCSFLGNWIMVS